MKLLRLIVVALVLTFLVRITPPAWQGWVVVIVILLINVIILINQNRAHL